MSNSTQITRLQNAKAAIKSAIEGKGVSVPETAKIDEYAARINDISTSPATSGDYRVRFIDYEGTVLLDTWVDAGASVTPPVPPAHEGLTFEGWNHDASYYTNVQRDLEIGAHYYTTDGYHQYHIDLTPVTGLTVTVYAEYNASLTGTIDWGDGEINAPEYSKSHTLTHTYSNYGEYVIRFDLTATTLGGGVQLGSGTNTTPAVSPPQCLKKVWLRNDTASTYISSYAFLQANQLSEIALPVKSYIYGDKPSYNNSALQNFAFCTHLKFITISANNAATLNGSFIFRNCILLKCVSLPPAYSALGTNFVNGCAALDRFVADGYSGSVFDPGITSRVIDTVKIPSAATAVGGLTSLVYVDLPKSVVTIRASTFFASPFALEKLIIRATSVCSLDNINAFTNITPLCKIYVPDELVALYKETTNWTTYADYIYPLSQTEPAGGT